MAQQISGKMYISNFGVNDQKIESLLFRKKLKRTFSCKLQMTIQKQAQSKSQSLNSWVLCSMQSSAIQ